MRTTATFSSKSPEKRWSVPIKLTNGSTAYVLSLEPDFDVEHHIVLVVLMLQRPGHESLNLLDPTGTVHGLQAYDFSADDLAQGVQKSAYGEKRMVSLKNLGLVVRMAISKATVSPVSRDKNQIDALELQIEVDNSNP